MAQAQLTARNWINGEWIDSATDLASDMGPMINLDAMRRVGRSWTG